MELIQSLLKEMEQEAQTTRKMLSIIPEDKFNWQPHPKSMTVIRLATHIAELPTWVSMVLTTDELDFATAPYTPKVINSVEDLLAHFEESLADGKAHLEKATLSQFDEKWTLRNGNDIYDVSPKGEVIRMAYCQIVHHRAQLGVFLRLLDVPIPGSYGPSADEEFKVAVVDMPTV
ncbi:DinB family protein [Chitinophaga filiformis]|uniref:DinB family protein n=1 Tax=Chitinophaga filiformis TaxID=104663 RepID=A0ABY4I166_CHIFI|nr:DinB family protein [Chitinophaga filiformis]UPK69537.1 DinB family protein [Chitinophaga filiformis]